MSVWPLRGFLERVLLSSMSGAAIGPVNERPDAVFRPKNSVNHRPTMALGLSLVLLILNFLVFFGVPDEEIAGMVDRCESRSKHVTQKSPWESD